MFSSLRSAFITYNVYACVLIGARMYIVIFDTTLRSRNRVSLFSVYRNTAFQLCELGNFIWSVR